MNSLVNLTRNALLIGATSLALASGTLYAKEDEKNANSEDKQQDLFLLKFPFDTKFFHSKITFSEDSSCYAELFASSVIKRIYNITSLKLYDLGLVHIKYQARDGMPAEYLSNNKFLIHCEKLK